MSCLIWNYRGLEVPLTVLVLRDMIRLLNPELAFLPETRCYSDYVESLKTRLNMFGFAVDRVCLSGGLALLWRKDVDASLLSFSQHHIDVQVQLQSNMG